MALQLSLPNSQNESRAVILSHTEKFPSKGHHATFVTALRPLNAHLSSASPLNVTLTIFAPTYVPNGSRVRITLTVRDKPNLKLIPKDSILGQKSFLFSITKSPLSIIDHEPPKCQNSFLCSNSTLCPSPKSAQNCQNHEFQAQILIRDEISGIHSIKPIENHQVLTEIVVGSANNETITVSGDCCHPNVILNLTDVAGNWKLCRASINHAQKSIKTNGYIQIILLFIVILLCIA